MFLSQNFLHLSQHLCLQSARFHQIPHLHIRDGEIDCSLQCIRIVLPIHSPLPLDDLFKQLYRLICPSLVAVRQSQVCHRRESVVMVWSQLLHILLVYSLFQKHSFLVPFLSSVHQRQVSHCHDRHIAHFGTIPGSQFPQNFNQ